MTLWQDWTPQQKQQVWKRWYRRRRFAERLQRSKEKKLMKPVPMLLKITTLTIVALVLLALLQGCEHLRLQPRYQRVRYTEDGALAAPLPPPFTWEQCLRISEKQLGMTIVGTGAGVIGSAITATSPAFPSTSAGRYGLIGVGSILTLTGSISGLLAGFYSKQYTAACTTNIGGQ